MNTPPYAVLRWWLTHTLLTLASATLALAVAEVAFRYHLYDRYEHHLLFFDSPLYKVIPYSRTAYRLIPNSWRTQSIPPPGQSHWTYRINARGFRGPDLAPPDDPRTLSVLVLGDSYTFGWAVNDVETYSARLEATLNSPGAHLMCRVINLGVPGYNTLQEYEVLRAEAALHRPSLVLLAYTVNDAEPQWTVPANPAHTYAASCLWLLDYFIDRLNRSLFPERPLFHGRAQEHSSRYMQGFAAQSPKWRTSRASLCDIGAFCRSEGVALLVVMLPDFTQRFDSSYCYTTIHHTVGQWCGELEIPFIDLLPCFLGCDHEEYWVAGDGHPNQGAHEKVAAHLLEPVRRAILASVMGLIEEMPLGSIPCGGACLGCIDAYDGRAVQGWAALEDTDSAQSRIVVLLAGVDRTYRVAVKRRLARPDVSRHYGVDGLYDHAGFWVCLALYAEAIKPGIYKIGVQVESGDRMGTMWSSHGYAAE